MCLLQYLRIAGFENDIFELVTWSHGFWVMSYVLQKKNYRSGIKNLGLT